MPLWEHIPDGEPYVFEDPDNPGKQRVYVYGSHDSRITDYCGRELVVWSAPVEDLNHWRYDGEILKVDKNRDGQAISRRGLAAVLFAPDVTLVTAPDGTKALVLHNVGATEKTLDLSSDKLDSVVVKLGTVTVSDGSVTLGANSSAVFLQ